MKINTNSHSAASKPADFNQPPLTNRVNKRVSTAGIIRLSFITAPLLLDYTDAAFITSSPFVSAGCRSCIFSQARIYPHLEQTGRNERLKNNEGAKPTTFYFIFHLGQNRPPRQQRRQVMRKTEMEIRVPTRRTDRTTRRSVKPSWCSLASSGISWGGTNTPHTRIIHKVRLF